MKRTRTKTRTKRKETRKKRADRLIVAAIKKDGNDILKAPAVIVNNLQGMGVNPAVKIIIKP